MQRQRNSDVRGQVAEAGASRRIIQGASASGTRRAASSESPVDAVSQPSRRTADHDPSRSNGPLSAPHLLVRATPFFGVVTLLTVLLQHGTIDNLPPTQVVAMILGVVLIVGAPFKALWRSMPPLLRPVPGALALTLVTFPTGDLGAARAEQWVLPVVLGGLTLVIESIPWGRLPQWLETVVLNAAIGSIILERNLYRPSDLLIFPLGVVAVLFAALYGRKVDLLGAALIVALAFWLPIPGEQLALDDILRDTTLTGVVLVMALCVFEVVTLARRQGQTLRETAKAARQHEALTSAILENTADGIVTIDGPGAILSINRAARQILGVNESDVLGRRLSTFVDAAGQGDFAAYLRTRLRHEGADLGSGSRETVGIRADGRTFPMEYNAGDTDEEDADVFIVSLRDITERKAQLDLLERQALHDGLTGLPNRVLFEDRFRQALRRAPRETGLTSVMMLDLNRFKEINDTYGHRAGDTVLRELGRRLTQTVRAADTVARIGGDEFVVLPTPVPDRPTLVELARKILAAVSEPVFFDGHRVDSGVSIGIAIYPEHGVEIDALVHQADEAMYLAKRQQTGYAVAGAATTRAAVAS